MSDRLQERSTNDPAVILAAQRTAIGSFQGQFHGVSAPQLGGASTNTGVTPRPQGQPPGARGFSSIIERLQAQRPPTHLSKEHP